MKPCAGNRATRPSQMWLPSSSSNSRRPQPPPRPPHAPVQVIIIMLVVLVVLWGVEGTCLGTPCPSRTMPMRTGTKMKTGPEITWASVQGCVAEVRTSARRSATHPRPRSRIQYQRVVPSFHYKEHIPGSSFDSASYLLCIGVYLCTNLSFLTPSWLVGWFAFAYPMSYNTFLPFRSLMVVE